MTSSSRANSGGTNTILVSATDVSLENLRNHIQATLPFNVVLEIRIEKRRNQKKSGTVKFRSVLPRDVVQSYVDLLRSSQVHRKAVEAQIGPLEPPATGASKAVVDVDSEARVKAKTKWDDAKSTGLQFFNWLHSGAHKANGLFQTVDLTSVDRDGVHRLFDAFVAACHSEIPTNDRRGLESLSLSTLRSQKLYKSKRYDDIVVCSFAGTDHKFATTQERQTARQRLLQHEALLQADKGGLHIPDYPQLDPDQPVQAIGQTVKIEYPITMEDDRANVKLVKVEVSGPSKSSYVMQTKTPALIVGANSARNGGHKCTSLRIYFASRSTGVYRANFIMTFQSQGKEAFSIVRRLMLKSGDTDIYDILKPKTPYFKKKRIYEKPVDPNDILNPPSTGRANAYGKLMNFKPPLDVRQLVESREMENTLEPPNYESNLSETEFADVYSVFWQKLLWVSELQAYEDIKLFDMENAKLQQSGRFLKLYVAGLAEGRPSVLRGDSVICTWNGKHYRGRVFSVEMLDVLLEFHKSFHQKFNVNLDSVNLVRFTFSRTTFRTSHVGALRAPDTMGMRMLLPRASHVEEITQQNPQGTGNFRGVPSNRLVWGSHNLNQEQKDAVFEIAKGTLRPMPYIIFGPPGTGKTTTIAEAVYQLARLHKLKIPNQKKLNILLVAPSNDATDILVEKLAPYFPPSEMLRVLSFSRTLDQVSESVRPYIREGLLETGRLGPEINSVQIVVSTVNLAARFFCNDIEQGHFDVLAVDEAGHATEPEVIAVAATLLNLNDKENPGQVVLAGDPRQLGPIIASNLCQKFGMSTSYMERLISTSEAYNGGERATGSYPRELVTLLVRNYRSHPSILKLPNEMFYNNKLVPCGDQMTTHSMAKWEHLPTKKGFPVVFHSVDGENLREGRSPSWFNPQEAIEVAHWVGLLAKHSRPPVRADEIGVITPYARQVQRIRTVLKVKDLGDVKVGSVETFQGQERRCIVISTVRSENELLEHDRKYNLGFVANKKRFNVALTRAKALVVVVGNPRVLATDKENWLPFLRYCRDNESWVGPAWDEAEEATDEMGAMSVNEEEDDAGQAFAPSHAAGQEGHAFINREE